RRSPDRRERNARQGKAPPPSSVVDATGGGADRHTHPRASGRTAVTAAGPAKLKAAEGRSADGTAQPMEMRRGLACSAFGTTIDSTPFSNLASTLSELTWVGS